MSLLYNGKKIEPAPFIRIAKDYERSDSDEKQGVNYNVSLIGTLVSYRGSPDSSGNFWILGGSPPDENIPYDDRLRALLRKRQALDCLFSEDGKLLEIFALNGMSTIKCYPKVQGIEWQEGIFVDKIQYTVNLLVDQIFTTSAAICESGIYNPALKRSNEEWQIEDNDKPDSFRLTHIVSAVGKLSYDSNGNEIKGWRNAQNWVLPRLGLEQEKILSSGVHNLPSYYGGFNYVRGNRTNEIEGSYEVTESWILSSGNYLEDFTVEKNTAEDGRITIGVQGTVEGLEIRDNQNWNPRTQTKYVSANAGFTTIVEPNMLNRAQTYGGVNVNPEPITKVIGKNPITGIINYNYSFNDRPSNLTNAKSETIEVTDDNQSDVFAAIPVIGRFTGPVLQSLGARTEKKRSLTIELVGDAPKYGSGTPSPINVEGIVASFEPTFQFLLFVSENVSSFDYKTGRQTRRVSWVYE